MFLWLYFKCSNMADAKMLRRTFYQKTIRNELRETGGELRN